MPRRIAWPAVLVVVLGLALLVPLLGNYYLHVFALVFINVILAASLRPSLTCGQLNIGHSAFMCLGAYTSALLVKFVPPETLERFVGSGAFAAAVDEAIVRVAGWLARPAELRTLLAEVHNTSQHMPAILHRDEYDSWLHGSTALAARVPLRSR